MAHTVTMVMGAIFVSPREINYSFMLIFQKSSFHACFFIIQISTLMLFMFRFVLLLATGEMG